ncbi:MAG: hypothetical protein R3E64_11190 [Halioglobus sp.]
MNTFTGWLLAIGLIFAGMSLLDMPAKAATDTEQAILERLAALEANQRKLESELRARDARIEELETRLQQQPTAQQYDAQTIAIPPSAATPSIASAPPQKNAPAQQSDDKEDIGRFRPGGGGFTIADTPMGSVNFGAWAYTRYLNQDALDKDYTDSFGRTFKIDRRNDFQVNKVNLTFTGWLFDPDFRYLLYTWTANTSQGDSAQVVVAGNMRYRFNKAVDIGLGIDALPGTRSMYGTFPFFNKVDMRTMADEFFRPSYTTGIWSSGELADRMSYKLMLGNNLSQLGVNAAQLDGGLNTISGRLQWEPTTGEFGPQSGYGDFEMHEHLATEFGLSATYSSENRQSQPGTDDIENSQIRLSDGTRLFVPNAFDTDGRVNNATYQMVSADAGMKYQGFSLSSAYYVRWVNDFKTEGEVPVDNLFDQGVELQTSYMFIPRMLQGYIASSKIFGEYGNPWDTAVGINWFPMKQRLLRVNGELLYLNNSPVGYSSIPYAIGGNGPILNTNVEMKF